MRSQRIHSSVPRQTLLSMGVIFFLIFLLLPWQVAFLVCWIIHFYTCAVSVVRAISHDVSPISTPANDGRGGEDREKKGLQRESQHFSIDNLNHKMHLLLLMTWLLPLTGPVLAVWVRTMMTAGFTTPFDGDHNFMNVAPYLILVDFASWSKGPLLERSR
jgi:glycosylphosphatidylinositol deacylase